MDEKIDIDTSVAFSYEVFDRQLRHFLQMSEVLADGWEDYDAKELSCDINSLYIKVSRLCYMADQDLALQHADVTQQRREENEHFHHQMEVLLKKKLSPIVLEVITGLKEGRFPMGHQSPMFPSELSSIFPRLFDLFEMEGMDMEKMKELQGGIQIMEQAIGAENPLLLQKLSGKSSQTSSYIPSQTETPLDSETLDLETSSDSVLSDLESEDEMLPMDSPVVEMLLRLWNFLRLYTLSSYLLLHFRRVCHVTSRPLEAEEAFRLTELKVQRYMSDEQGKHNLDLYQARLRYENDGKPLDVNQWLKARRELKSLVPPQFELAFLYYADDTSKAGEELTKISFTLEEFDALIDALAKYQLITRRIYEINHPEEQTHTLPNEAFNLVVNGRTVDLLELKKSITKMVRLVEKKNQWFCVWSVLKHFNLIKEGATFATFAHQMMSPEWFGKTDGIVFFTADNLSDYSHYFNEYDYTDWDEELFLEKKALYGMTKWSPKLCQNFSHLCERMMKAILGYSFLQ